MNPQPPAVELAQDIVAALLGSGITHVAYCPGSRNAPFAYSLAVAEAEGHVVVEPFGDERSAGFWAVGYAKGSGKPVAVVTTSGTAAAELHAALDEAKHQWLPVVAITADRSHEQRGVGASQTTDQEGIFGQAVIAADAIPAGGKRAGVRVNRLVETARGTFGDPGPVHLNVAFREPLVPAAPLKYLSTKVPMLVPSEPRHPTWEDVVDQGLETLVIAGDRASRIVVEAAANRGIPILAEPTSGARDLATAIAHGPLVAQVLADAVEQVVVTGRPTLSRTVKGLLGIPSVRKIVVSPHQPWPDESGTADLIIQNMRASVPKDNGSLKMLQLARSVEAVVEGVLADREEHDLLNACREIWRADPQVPLWLGASNTVRGFDLAASGLGPAKAYANRGLAGIDGTVASAAGLSVGLACPVRAVMGDLTFAHDLSSLTGSLALSPDLQVIVFDDGGGSIFASLEHGEARFADLYERYFAVAPRLDAAAAALACGWRSKHINDRTQLVAALAEPVVGRSVLRVALPRSAEAIRELQKSAQDRIQSHSAIQETLSMESGY